MPIGAQRIDGFGEAFRTEELPRYDLEAVWDDRVLRRAARSADGFIHAVQLGALGDREATGVRMDRVFPGWTLDFGWFSTSERVLQHLPK